MATITNGLKKTVNPKMWEFVGINPFSSNTSGSFVTGEYSPYIKDNDLYYVVNGAGSIYRYSASENAYLLNVASGIAGTFTAGAAGETMSYGCPGGEILLTATGGTTTTIVTNKTLAENCVGSKIKIIQGPNAGNEYTIAYNSVGANATIVLSEAAPLAFNTSTKFHIMTGSMWFFCPSTTQSGFAVFDVATNAWTQRSMSPITTYGTDAQLLKQHNSHDNYVSGDVVSATSTSITVSGLTGVGYDWTNYEVVIVSGTGAGQYRRITAGGATSNWTTAAWTVIPDATSKYCVKGDRHALYLCGNGSVNMYKYDISTNTWALIAPTTVRTGALIAGGSADIIKDVPDWAIPVVSTGKVGGQNARFIYSFRGGSSAVLDLYDIAANKWINDVTFGARGVIVESGSCAVTDGRYIYIMHTTTGRYTRFDAVENTLKPFAHQMYPQVTATTGDKMFVVKVVADDGTALTWLYSYLHSLNTLYRMLII